MKKVFLGNRALKDIQNLVDLGLTHLEATIYVVLLENNSMSIRELANHLSLTKSSTHRTIKSLKEKRLVITYKGSKQLQIRAIDPTVAVSNYVQNSWARKIEILKSLERSLVRSHSATELGVEFLENKQVAFETGIKRVDNSSDEIIIFSVGEQIPQELLLSFVKAIKRGVEVKLIVQKFNDSNKELLNNWKKNGYKIRYFNKDALDFTLLVYDKKVSELHIRLPENPDNRVGIVIHNSSYSKAQYQYLLELWNKAREI